MLYAILAIWVVGRVTKRIVKKREEEKKNKNNNKNNSNMIIITKKAFIPVSTPFSLLMTLARFYKAFLSLTIPKHLSESVNRLCYDILSPKTK